MSVHEADGEVAHPEALRQQTPCSSLGRAATFTVPGARRLFSDEILTAGFARCKVIIAVHVDLDIMEVRLIIPSDHAFAEPHVKQLGIDAAEGRDGID